MCKLVDAAGVRRVNV